MKVLIHGIEGAMGRFVQSSLENEGIDYIGFDPLSKNPEVYTSFEDIPKVDVIIDFSHFSIVDALLDYAVSSKTPLVLCTTGLEERTLEKLEQASKDIAVFKSGNMSLGINVMTHLVKIATGLLTGFDIEIIEKHHNKKVDAPSGTAYMIADAVEEIRKLNRIYGRFGNEKRNVNEIGIHTVRGGTITGEHSILFAGQDETFEIKHQAYSKKVFAEGAVAASKYLIGKQASLYDMNDLLGG